MRNKYTVGYFIRKFKAIPANRWCIGVFINARDQKCVLGHLGARGIRLEEEFQMPESAAALVRLVRESKVGYDIADINNCPLPGFRQTTPRGRVLAALNSIKRGGK